MLWSKACVLFIFLLNFQLNDTLTFVPVGAIFDKNGELNKAVLEYAVSEANRKVLNNSRIILKPEVETVSGGNVYAVSQSVCNLLTLQVGVIFGPEWPSSVEHVINVCDSKEIPYIDTHFDADAASKLSVVNMYPSQDTLVQLLIDVVKAFKWEKFTILYESPMWLQRIAELLEINNKNGQTITMRRLVHQQYDDFRMILKRVKTSSDTNIIVECSIEMLMDFFEQALQVGLLTDHYHLIVTNLDTHNLKLDKFKYGGANLTTFRIANPDNYVTKDFFDYLNETAQLTYPQTEFANNQLERCQDDEYQLDHLNMDSALIYDGVMVFANALRQLGYHQIKPVELDCRDSKSIWQKGYTISNYMKNTKFNGITGNVEFDNQGLRRDVMVEVLELRLSGLETFAKWKWNSDVLENRLTITRRLEENIKVLKDSGKMRNQTIKVISALVDPYTMLKQTTVQLMGNDRYEGFAIDLIYELSIELGFNYEIIVQEDGNYGVCINNITQEWNGVIGELRAGRADLAIGDLTITSDRLTAIDFTPAIMNLGIAILYRKPMKQPPLLFAFMSPFSQSVWLCLGGAYIMVSLCFFCLGRISPSQWENPYPCIEEPTHLENQFSLQNSMWFAIGALLQQGSEIEPKAASIRLASSVWWFFTLIMVSSYTANLAAFLTIDNFKPLITSVHDLKECGVSEERCPVQFGAKKGGSTFNSFKTSNENDTTYHSIYNYMMKHPELLTTNNDDGLKRALFNDYAFLMESSSIQYYTERFCNITQVGGMIDEKNYAIGMRKDYEHYSELSEAVLQLQERGILDKLYTMWWKVKRGGGACSKTEGGSAQKLEMANMYGVFLVLVMGIILACIYGCIETLVITYKKSKKEKLSYRDEVKAELKFLIKSRGNTKPVRYRNKQSLSIQSGMSQRTDRSQDSKLIR